MEPLTGANESVLTLREPAGVDQAMQLQAEALAIPPSVREAFVDCSGAERLHCAALQMLLSLRAELQQRGMQLCIQDANYSIRQFAEIAGLSGLFDPQ